MPGVAPSPVVIPLSEVHGAGPELVGGKARGFSTIARAGLEAPEGFVITTAAYRAAAGSSGLPDHVARDVARLVEDLGNVPLAVRSSATGEDGAEASHAGQYLTRLGVRGLDEVLPAIAA